MNLEELSTINHDYGTLICQIYNLSDIIVSEKLLLECLVSRAIYLK